MRFARLAPLIVVSAMSAISCSDTKHGGVRIDGAGATFPAPLYQKWFESYQAAHPDVKVGYDDVGSGAGIQLFSGSLVDFGASDVGMSDEQIKQVAKGGVQHVPTTAGMVVMAYNLTGVSEPLKLSREAYAGIWLGKITQWDNEKIKETNPGVTLPSTNITPVHRLGASGTTFVFTRHLSAVSEEWRKKYSQGLTVEWPAGTGAKGKDGVVSFIQQTPGAIGYVDFGTAVRNELMIAGLENKAGEYVMPGPESCQAAFADATIPEDLRLAIPDPEGKGSYPLVTFTWILAHAKYDNPKKAAAVKELLKFGLTDGQDECGRLGYVPLPESLRLVALEAVDRIGP